LQRFVVNHIALGDLERSTGALSLNGKQLETIRAPNQGGAPGWSFTRKPVVVKLTDDIRRDGFSIGASVGYARCPNRRDVDQRQKMRTSHLGAGRSAGFDVAPRTQHPSVGGRRLRNRGCRRCGGGDQVHPPPSPNPPIPMAISCNLIPN
jgi:hypothetical protein